MRLFQTEIECCGDCPFSQVIDIPAYDRTLEPMYLCRKKFLADHRITDNGYVRGVHDGTGDKCKSQIDTIPSWCPLMEISKEIPSEVLYNNEKEK